MFTILKVCLFVDAFIIAFSKWFHFYIFNLFSKVIHENFSTLVALTSKKEGKQWELFYSYECYSRITIKNNFINILKHTENEVMMNEVMTFQYF